MKFYDIGITQRGDLYINVSGNNRDVHVLTITRSGEVHIKGKLFVNGNPVG